MATNVIPFPRSRANVAATYPPKHEAFREAADTLSRITAEMASLRIGSQDWHMRRVAFDWWSKELLAIQNAQGGLVA